MHKTRIFLIFALLLSGSVLLSELASLSTGQSIVIPQGFSITSDWLQRHDRLSRLDVLRRVLDHIRQHYVDPNRVEPPAMFKKVLDSISRSVPEVRVLHPMPKQSVLIVAKERKEFDTSLTTLYGLRTTISDALKFVRSHKNSDISDKDLEIAAVRGVLNPLDPHSIYLPEDLYKETKVGTAGKFGGLGIVIAIRDMKLTVIAPLEGTPASKAGLKAKDYITHIGNESTINMSLTEAVGKMRGPKGVPITITVLREGWTKGKDFTIVRDIIRIVSVESELLPNRIGFIKIKSFQGNTGNDLSRHLRNLKKEAGGSLAGLIVDLRNNPGGLLDQAVTVSDKFIARGPLVTTVGLSNTVREQELATLPGTEEETPLVLLVNEGSASASEIVAGAIQRRDRGLIIGRRTFGKGTVQSIYELPDEAALKLTIAQYLTPGDFSIQEIGIVPDIRTVPAFVSKDRVDVFRNGDRMGEVSLERHFSRLGDPVKIPDPKYTLRYFEGRDDEELADLYATPPSKEMPKAARVAQYLGDFEIKTARELLISSSPKSDRKALLRAFEKISGSIIAKENKKLIAGLSSKDIDWSPLPAPKKKCNPPVSTSSIRGVEKGLAKAGNKIKLAVTLHNKSKCPLSQFWISTKSESYIFKDREILFGRVPAGGTMTRDLEVEIPKFTPSTLAEVEFIHHEEHQTIPKNNLLSIPIRSIDTPRFAFTYEINDTKGGEAIGNGNGEIEENETIELRVRVKNVGKAASEEASAALKNRSGATLLLKRGRENIPELLPGKEKVISFLFEVRKPEKRGPLEFTLTLSDTAYRSFTQKELSLNLKAKEPGSPSISRKSIQKIGQTFFQPPEITANFDKLAFAAAPDQFVELNGTLSDDQGIKDFFVLVNGKKVHYRSYQDEENLGNPQSFQTVIPLEVGLNEILLVARDSQDLQDRKALVITRVEEKSTQTKDTVTATP